MTASAVLLVRHTQVARAWQGRCYGQSDMSLSRDGASHVRALAPKLAEWRPDIVMHSGLWRARFLAEAVAKYAGKTAHAEPGWVERDFGFWEGRTWATIYRETGSAMDGMVDDPWAFRPGGGETTMELAERSVAALGALPSGRVLVITHGGPIAAIVGTRDNLPVREWLKQVPITGAFVEICS